MTKEELKAIAVKGVRNVLLDYEYKLADIFREFPDEFVSATAPVLARPELRNGNGHGGPRVKGVSVVTGKKAHKAYGSASAVTARRQISADVLEVVAKSARPMQIPEMVNGNGNGIDARAILPLIRRGYLKKTKQGYVRTAKVFYVKKSDAERVAREKRA
jgi:hypothetical protein